MIDIAAIRQANPLPSIVAAAVKLQRAGHEWKGCCPFHSDRSPSFTIFADGERFHCFGCGASGDVLDYVQRLHRVPLAEAAKMLGADSFAPVQIAKPKPVEPSNRVAEAVEIWRASKSAIGSPVERYLHRRAIRLTPPSIRFDHLAYGQIGTFPCLIAAVQDLSGEVVGIQRTYLRHDGSGKAAVPKPKLSLGKISGGAIRLGDLDAKGTITVCEGLEDGLTLLQVLGEPVWVAAGASMLPAMQFPASVQSIVIGADNDEAGVIAANRAAETFDRRGLHVRTIRPSGLFKDFNAELQGDRA